MRKEGRAQFRNLDLHYHSSPFDKGKNPFGLLQNSPKQDLSQIDNELFGVLRGGGRKEKEAPRAQQGRALDELRGVEFDSSYF